MNFIFFKGSIFSFSQKVLQCTFSGVKAITGAGRTDSGHFPLNLVVATSKKKIEVIQQDTE